MVIYHPLIDSCLYESNSQHLMLYFHEDNIDYYEINPKKTFPTNMSESLVIHKKIFCLDGTYNEHEMSDSSISHGVIFYSKKFKNIYFLNLCLH